MNVKMPTIVGILTLMSRINFMLSGVEQKKKIKFYSLKARSECVKADMKMCSLGSIDPLNKEV